MKEAYSTPDGSSLAAGVQIAQQLLSAVSLQVRNCGAEGIAFDVSRSRGTKCKVQPVLFKALGQDCCPGWFWSCPHWVHGHAQMPPLGGTPGLQFPQGSGFAVSEQTNLLENTESG